MNIPQRVLLIFVSVCILIGGVVTILSPTIAFWEYFAFLVVLPIPTILFFYAISSPKAPHESRKDEKKVQLNNLVVPKKITEEYTDMIKNLRDLKSRTLYRVIAVFPFDFFPNEIIIHQKQVLIIYRYFFFAAREFPILIRDIMTPIVETSLLFATLRIELAPGGYFQDPQPIMYLRKKEAIRARHIILGLIVCDRAGIDLSSMTDEEMTEKVEDIGRTSFS